VYCSRKVKEQKGDKHKKYNTDNEPNSIQHELFFYEINKIKRKGKTKNTKIGFLYGSNIVY
jgi:hypothetical protein